MSAIKLKPGIKAPDFTLPDSYESKITIKGLSGKWIVLYFYPKDNTSGCTTEALDFTALKGSFDALNAAIIGISPDSCRSHQKFAIKYDLGIILLSDPDKKALKKYGVWGKKKMYGRDYYGVVRSSFLINPKGTIAHIWENVRVEDHAEEVLGKLKELAATPMLD